MGAAFRPGWNSSKLGPVFICVDDMCGWCFSQGLLQLCHFRAKGAGSVKGEDLDDEESADEGDDGDFTVYECPGLAPVSWSSTWGQLQMSCYCQAELNSINWTPRWHCDSTPSETRLHWCCLAQLFRATRGLQQNKFDIGTKLCKYRAIVSLLDSVWPGSSTTFETGLVS